MAFRPLSLLLVGAAVLGGCGAPETPSDEGEGALVPSVETAEPSGAVSAFAYCDDVTTWDPAWANLEAQVLTLVNQRRAAGATCGGVAKPAAPALTLDTRLRCAARKHSRDMGTNNFMGHTGSDGSTPWQRMTLAGYTYRSAAENVAAGYSTAAAVVNGWMSSTGHCNNIMNPGLTQLGVGYYYAPSSTYRHYWTQAFGRP
ncbi:CAP domain-containing protein [Pyxidicoccus xibeiensis]|uniref:CAP domain-containing protein n=1 Tax=Pyxidicoccus xibeiensis TaxID=2906759 RepID=UPI0020A8337F|nr:CAP domain-containing protein [Pyxidicoccus xibeiensis]MCP3144361.1 CAP domain-containing protein [Pyxidicoccus xibeiensis]